MRPVFLKFLSLHILVNSGGKCIFEHVSSVRGTAQFGVAACLSYHNPMYKDSDIQTGLCPTCCASGVCREVQD